MESVHTVSLQCPMCGRLCSEASLGVTSELESADMRARTLFECPQCHQTSYREDWVRIGRHYDQPKKDKENMEPKLTQSQQDIVSACDEIKNLLLEKNRKYGDSALNPVRVFSKADPVEQIKVRLDDKISRLRNQQSDDDEDVTLDLLGYLILLRVAQKRAKEETR